MRDTDIVFKTLTGDTEAADRLMGIARTHIGILKQQMALGGLKVGSRTVAFPDGSSIRIVVAGGQTRMMLTAATETRGGAPFELPPVGQPLIPQYAVEAPYAICVAAYHGVNGIQVLSGDYYNPMPVVINGVQYEDSSGRMLASGHVRFDWATVPNADLPAPSSFVTAVYQMDNGVQASKYLASGGNILRNGQIYEPIRTFTIRSVQDFVNVLNDVNNSNGGPYILFGELPAPFATVPFNANATVEVNLSSPPWDSGVQVRLEGGADKNFAPLTVDIPAGAEVYAVGGTGGATSGTITFNNLTASVPTGVDGLNGFVPFNDEVGYDLDITLVCEAGEVIVVGESPFARFTIQFYFGHPNWPPIDPTKPLQFIPTYPAKDAEADYTVQFEIDGDGALNKLDNQAAFLIYLEARGGVTTLGEKGLPDPWFGTTSATLIGTIAIPDGWGGTRTIRVNASVTMTVVKPPPPPPDE